MTTDPRALIAEGRTAIHGPDSYPRNLMRRLLDGYASALDENERLTVEACKEAAATHELAEEHEKQGMDLAFHRRGHRAALAELVTLRSSLAEQSATIAHLTQLAAERYEDAEEVHALAGDAVQGARPTIAALRQEVGELKPAIEQQGREVERVRVGLTAIRDNLINAGAAYHGASPGCVEAQLDIIERLLTIQGAPCTTK